MCQNQHLIRICSILITLNALYRKLNNTYGVLIIGAFEFDTGLNIQ